MKKKGLIILVAVIAVIVVIALSLAGVYNGMVEKQQSVEEAQSTISAQLQRRADLIPNFLSSVKGYTDYEQSTYTAVTEARSAVSKASTVEETQAAEDRLNGAISVWVNAVTEAYPDLKANDQFIAFEDELAGTENRIMQARKDYNAVAKEYNVSIKKFPRNIFASLFGFEKADYFESTDTAESVPQVSFE